MAAFYNDSKDWVTGTILSFSSKVSLSAAFISLLGNYETSTGVEEVVTPEEIAENNCFLDAILMTGVMKVSNEFSFCHWEHWITDTQIFVFYPSASSWVSA